MGSWLLFQLLVLAGTFSGWHHLYRGQLAAVNELLDERETLHRAAVEVDLRVHGEAPIPAATDVIRFARLVLD